MGTIILTSTGLSAKKVFKFFSSLPNLNNKSVAIITTAAKNKNNKYCQLTKKQFKAIGYKHLNFLDLNHGSDTELDKYDIILVCGGNTFKLLAASKKFKFKKIINRLLRRGGIYVGVSAGSLILGPSIKIAGEINPDDNIAGLKNLAGLKIISQIIFPHYKSTHESAIRLFEKTNNVIVSRLADKDAIFIRK